MRQLKTSCQQKIKVKPLKTFLPSSPVSSGSKSEGELTIGCSIVHTQMMKTAPCKSATEKLAAIALTRGTGVIALKLQSATQVERFPHPSLHNCTWQSDPTGNDSEDEGNKYQVFFKDTPTQLYSRDATRAAVEWEEEEDLEFVSASIDSDHNLMQVCILIATTSIELYCQSLNSFLCEYLCCYCAVHVLRHLYKFATLPHSANARLRPSSVVPASEGEEVADGDKKLATSASNVEVTNTTLVVQSQPSGSLTSTFMTVTPVSGPESLSTTTLPASLATMHSPHITDDKKGMDIDLLTVMLKTLKFPQKLGDASVDECFFHHVCTSMLHLLTPVYQCHSTGGQHSACACRQ
ncbi:hypothetical protein M422DRAFT_45229 [Sphaerobolus stellatus SS14]|nr:hypothetical protein M422DRAFT_45229 [Sphaerobolus stellatus SS14]